MKKFLRWLIGIDLDEVKKQAAKEIKAKIMEEVYEIDFNVPAKNAVIGIIKELLESEGQTSYQYIERFHMGLMRHSGSYSVSLSAEKIKQFLETTIQVENKDHNERLREWLTQKVESTEFADKIIESINKKQIHIGSLLDPV